MSSFNRIEQNIRRRHRNTFDNRLETLGEEIEDTVMSGRDHDLLETRAVVENLIDNHWEEVRDVIHATLVTQNWPELQRSIQQCVRNQVLREINDDAMENAMERHIHEDMVDEIEVAADAHMDFLRDEG